jgi:mRNA interferase MazF
MRKPAVPECGEVWSVLLDPIVGHEQGGMRPALVISNDAFNRLPHGLCIIAPITRTDRHLPTQFAIQAPEGGLSHDSTIMCDQLRAISVLRLRQRRGRVDQATLEEVQALVGLFIDR